VGEHAGRDRAQPVAVGPPRRRAATRSERMRAQRARRRRRRLIRLVTTLLVAVVVAAAFVGARLWHTLSSSNDYHGNGKSDVVIQIRSGDSTTAIGETLQDHNVVRTVKAFIEAAQGNSKISAIQPGYYQMRTESSAAAAVQRLADPNNRVGRLVIPEGRQLEDTTDVQTNTVTPGIFSLISAATCVNLNGDRHCASVRDLRAAAGTTPAPVLEVPEWAVSAVLRMGTDHRRIEGLIAPGTFNVNPSGSPQKILATLISTSAVEYAKSGLVDTAQEMHMSPYDVLVVASLVQGEAKPRDFPKVARVIYNRLAVHRPLELDSTVNYPLDRREVATTDADREASTPWNTYVRDGLPATPICSPGTEALLAAEHPEPGDWLYFVTIDPQGTTLFTRNYQQHLENIELAKRNGVLDSAR
jgi:UPF0755 protein